MRSKSTYVIVALVVALGAGAVVLYHQLSHSARYIAERVGDIALQATNWDSLVGHPLEPPGLVVFRSDTVADLFRLARLARVRDPEDTVAVFTGRWRSRSAESELHGSIAIVARLDTTSEGRVILKVDSMRVQQPSSGRRPDWYLYLSLRVGGARLFGLYFIK
jgi:hypothetical protein